jgi:hypothetical protein
VRRGVLLVVLLTACVALAGAVTAGWTRDVDTYTVARLWPWRACPYHPQASLAPLVAPLPAAFCHSPPPFYEPSATGRAAFVVAASAAPLPALLLLTALVAIGPRGRRRWTLAVGLCALGAATLAEVVGKDAVTRGAIDRVVGGHVHTAGIGHTFPCGHTIRVCVIAYVAARIHPICAAAALVWLLAVNVALVATSGHTLTDIAGGLLVGGGVATAMSLALWTRPRPAAAILPAKA